MYANINDSLNSLVYKTNLILKGKLQAYLREFDITTEQWVMLNRLLRKDGYNQKELSIESYKEQAAVTRTLDILENKGLIARKKSAADRREYLVFITENGKNLLEKTRPYAKAYQEMLNAVLCREEMETLEALLRKLCKGLQPD